MDEQQLDSTSVMIDDLARRVAQTSVEASSWKARALVAEQALEQMRQAEGGSAPGPDLKIVEDEQTDG
jgi:hypothetical protein